MGDCGGLRLIPGMTKARATAAGGRRRARALRAGQRALQPARALQRAAAPRVTNVRAPAPDPRAPQNGKQKTPDWLGKLLGVEAEEGAAGGMTLEELLKVE